MEYIGVRKMSTTQSKPGLLNKGSDVVSHRNELGLM